MFDLHDLPASRVQVAVSDQFACAQPAAVHHDLTLGKRLPQICNCPLHDLAAAHLESAHQVVEKDRCIDHRCFKGIAIRVTIGEFLCINMTEAIDSSNPPGIRAGHRFELKYVSHEGATALDTL